MHDDDSLYKKTVEIVSHRVFIASSLTKSTYIAVLLYCTTPILIETASNVIIWLFLYHAKLAFEFLLMTSHKAAREVLNVNVAKPMRL